MFRWSATNEGAKYNLSDDDLESILSSALQDGVE